MTHGKGTIVNATSKDGETYKAEIIRINKDKSCRVQFDDGSQETVKASAISERKRGRKALEAQFTADEITGQVDSLQEELEAAIEAKDIPAQKRIRRKLRRRGHKGGLIGIEGITVVGKKEAEAAGIEITID